MTFCSALALLTSLLYCTVLYRLGLGGLIDLAVLLAGVLVLVILAVDEKLYHSSSHTTTSKNRRSKDRLLVIDRSVIRRWHPCKRLPCGNVQAHYISSRAKSCVRTTTYVVLFESTHSTRLESRCRLQATHIHISIWGFS